MTDQYFVNGVDIASRAVQLSTAEGLQAAPQWRDRDLEIPGQHGILDVGSDPTGPRRSFGFGQITFTGWIQGVDPVTGDFVGDDLGDYFARVDELLSMFYARTLQIDHVRPDGVRRAVAKLAALEGPAREASSPWFGRWQATCVIPGAFWSDIAPVTASATLPTGGTLNLAALAGSNAPIADGLITFGPGSNPTLVQGGTFVAYDGVISAGRQLTVDCADWSLGIGSGSSWTPSLSALRYGPGPAWFELDPTAGLAAVLQHTGGGSMFVSFSARRRFLTS